MKIIFPVLLAVIAVALCSCETTSTAPTVADLDRYYKEATRRADVRIAALAQQRNSGSMSQEEFDQQAQLIRADIPRKANDMAWTRHELAESEKRAQGIPTPEAPVQVGSPQPGGMGGSFYKQAGDPAGNRSNGDVRTFSPAISGYAPGSIAGKQGGLGGGF